jgi:ATP-binding cassette subfamily B multidrug efflux pump
MEKNAEKSGKIFNWITLRRLLYFAKPHKTAFLGLVFLTILAGALSPIRPYLIQLSVDKYMAEGDMGGLTNMALLMIGLLILQSIAQYTQTYLSGWLGQTIIRDIRVKLYNHILSLKLKFFDNTQIGRLVTRNISDIETLSDVFSEGLASMAGDLLQLVFIVVLMFYTNWKLSLVSLSMFPLLIISTYVFKEKLKGAFNDARIAVANLNAFVQEHVTGMNIVQIFGAEQREFKKFEVINQEHKRANIKSVLYYSVYFPVAEVIGAAGTGLLVWYGAKGVIAEEVTLGTLIAFIMYIAMFFRPIRAIADRFNTLQMGIVSIDRILKLLDNNDVIPETGVLSPVKLQGQIEFKQVWFAYNQEEWVLKNVSFSIKAGETVAFVGATGAGKSSIINLLTRFYDVNQGEIDIDNVPIQDYRIAALKRCIGVVLQDVFLFSGSIMNNITLGNPEITAEQVKHAAELVGANKFIDNLPGGYNYPVMERGATLSVGQRQLISFVRAMVYDPNVIVLDEATSSVDSETEELIQTAIEKLMAGRTSVIVAHRLSTIQKANQIIVLDKGEVVEKGSHEQLLQRNGHYAHLYQMQFKHAEA